MEENEQLNRLFEYIQDDSKMDVMEEFCTANPHLINMNNPKRSGQTPLIFACIEGKLDIVQFLVEEMNAELEMNADKGGTALYYSVWKGHLNIVQYLLDEGARLKPGTWISDSQIIGMDLDEICGDKKRRKKRKRRFPRLGKGFNGKDPYDTEENDADKDYNDNDSDELSDSPISPRKKKRKSIVEYSSDEEDELSSSIRVIKKKRGKRGRPRKDEDSDEFDEVLEFEQTGEDKNVSIIYNTRKRTSQDRKSSS